jgi:hypothetical protein
MAEMFGTMPDPTLIPEARPPPPAKEIYDPDPRGIPPTKLAKELDVELNTLEYDDHASESDGEGEIYLRSPRPSHQGGAQGKDTFFQQQLADDPGEKKSDASGGPFDSEIAKLAAAALAGGLIATIAVVAFVRR